MHCLAPQVARTHKRQKLVGEELEEEKEHTEDNWHKDQGLDAM